MTTGTENDSEAGDINSGSLAGFNAFCRWLVQRGGMKSGAVDPVRSATNQILATVEAAAADSVDLRTIDVDEYFGRFENKAGHKYSPNSLRAYRSRFGRGLELYRQYLEQGAGNFRPPPGRATRRTAGAPSTQSASKRVPVGDAPSSTSSPGTSPQPTLVDYPFPLKSGALAHLFLPQRLEKDDAERMAAFVRALVFDSQRQITTGGESDS
jgi:hypothetical protein